MKGLAVISAGPFYHGVSTSHFLGLARGACFFNFFSGTLASPGGIRHLRARVNRAPEPLNRAWDTLALESSLNLAFCSCFRALGCANRLLLSLNSLIELPCSISRLELRVVAHL